MKNKFNNPELEVIDLTDNDIITTSVQEVNNASGGQTVNTPFRPVG